MSVPLITAYPLRPSRMHEACGPGAVSFALRTTAHTHGDTLWVREQWLPEQLLPAGFEGLDPSRLILAQTKSQTDTLAIMEEALRDGAAPFVVAQITAPISLTAGRRLQLAAKAGGATGLCLIPDGMGSNVAETRWHCAPVFDQRGSTLQLWQLKRNKSGTTGAWHVRWDAQKRCIAVVPPAVE